MLKSLLLAGAVLAFVGSSAAADSLGILDDNLATAQGQFRGGKTGDRYYNSWVAIDYTPTAGVTVTTFRHHYLYNTAPLKNQLNFQLIRGENPRVGSVVSTWSVRAANWNEINTGWFAFGRPVYLCVVPFSPGRALAARVRYWFAYQSENTQSANVVYWCYHYPIKGEVMWHYLSGRWQSSVEWGYGNFDMSYRIDGGFTAVTPASLGKVKALLR